MNTITIRTTQNIELEYPVSGIGDRILATLIDSGILVGYLIACQLISTYTGVVYGNEGWIILLIPVALYSLISEVFFNGQSIGKRLMNMQVVKLDGTPPSLSNYLLRWLLKPVDVWVSYGLIAIISISISKHLQRLGDLAAGTSVIKLKLVTTFGETIFEEIEKDYVCTFPQIELLTDRDIAIIKDILDKGTQAADSELLSKLSGKVKNVTGITTDMGDTQFLQTILKDYNYLYGGAVAEKEAA